MARKLATRMLALVKHLQRALGGIMMIVKKCKQIGPIYINFFMTMNPFQKYFQFHNRLMYSINSVYKCLIFASYLFIMGSCTQNVEPVIAKGEVPGTVGVAHLTKDGVLEVTLRAEGGEGENKMVGDAFFAFRKTDPKYNQFIKLVGGLRRGETKPVPGVENEKNEPRANQ